jgi:hypothetical protein
MIMLPNRRCTAAETAGPFLSIQRKSTLFRLRHTAPTDRCASATDRQGAELLGVDGKLMQRKAERLRGLRLEQHRITASRFFERWGELTHQQAKMRFVLLAGGDVDRRSDQPGDRSRDVAQRLHMQIVPVQVAGVKANAPERLIKGP